MNNCFSPTFRGEYEEIDRAKHEKQMWLSLEIMPRNHLARGVSNTEFLDYVYTRGDFSGFVTNPNIWGTRFVLPFTHRCVNPKQQCPSLAASPEILNPKSKVNTLYPITDQSALFFSVNSSCKESGYFSA